MSWIKKDNISVRNFDYEVKLTWGDSKIDEENKIIYHRKHDIGQKGYIYLDFILEGTDKHLFIQLYGNKWGIPKTSVKKEFTHEYIRNTKYQTLFGEDSPFPKEYTFYQNKHDYLYQIIMSEEVWFTDVHPRFVTGVAWLSFEEAFEKLNLNINTKFLNSKFTIL